MLLLINILLTNDIPEDENRGPAQGTRPRGPLAPVS